jgi:hypothetical protein
MNEHCWLPELICYYDYGGNWTNYQDAIYSIFKSDFVDSKPYFENKQVRIRKHPMEYGKEEAFFHVTCQDYQKNGERVPDFRRCERIRWVRSFIENYECDLTQCENCDGIKVWREPYKANHRIHLLFEEERYIVVLEHREKYCLLITAFYIEHEHMLNKKLKRYDRYRASSSI